MGQGGMGQEGRGGEWVWLSRVSVGYETSRSFVASHVADAVARPVAGAVEGAVAAGGVSLPKFPVPFKSEKWRAKHAKKYAGQLMTILEIRDNRKGAKKSEVVKPDWWPEGLKSEFKDYYPSRSSQKDNETVIQAILNHYGEQNSNVEIPYQVIDNHVVFNIPGGSDNLENIMYPIENLDNVVEREINLNDM